MRAFNVAVIALLFSAFCRPFAAQELRTEVIVKIPSRPPSSDHKITEAEVTVNGQTQTTKLGGQAVFNLSARDGDSVLVEVKPVREGVAYNHEVKGRRQAVRLNGSGHLEYAANFEGFGSFGQWPLVDFQGSVSLDVFVDGEVKGTTETSKGVRPDQKHEFEWKNGTSKVCNMEVTLPVNVRRIYLCDAATKKVKEQ